MPSATIPGRRSAICSHFCFPSVEVGVARQIDGPPPTAPPAARKLQRGLVRL